MKFVVDKRAPRDTIYVLDSRYVHWGVPWWRRLLAKLRREWWA